MDVAQKHVGDVAMVNAEPSQLPRNGRPALHKVRLTGPEHKGDVAATGRRHGRTGADEANLHAASIVAVSPQLSNRSRTSSASSSGHTMTTARPVLCASIITSRAFRVLKPGTERTSDRTT